MRDHTIESQIAELKRRIAVDGHELLEEYVFTDDGRRGSNLEREGLKKLRDKVAEGKINKIYIYSLDRLSRDPVDQRDVIDEFKRARVEIIFSNHKVDDTPESDWLCCIATYERLTIARIISNLLKILFFCNQSDQI
ncbi:recombinase family protein [Wolbachia endosymbiont (group A) of Urophora cardui]|uniref:recombinase family protein n=1 Tax=Wolbachia endosymbiont (group A) of Urophora cardui TaxID=3066156 RepID=UPI003340D439